MDETVKRLTRAGGAMANLCFNLKQQTYGTERIRQQMDEAQTEWDAALAEFPAASTELSRLTRELAELREAAAATPEAKGEASYQAYRRAMAEEFADEPADLPGTLRMLDEWGPDALPANESGQIHFARALLESAADAIRKHLATAAKEG